MLNNCRIPFVRFDGSMNAKKRQAVLETFSEPLTKDEDEFDEDDTEPDSDDERYEAWHRWKKGKGTAKERALARFLERGIGPNPVVMLISLKVSIPWRTTVNIDSLSTERCSWT